MYRILITCFSIVCQWTACWYFAQELAYIKSELCAELKMNVFRVMMLPVVTWHYSANPPHATSKRRQNNFFLDNVMPSSKIHKSTHLKSEDILQTRLTQQFYILSVFCLLSAHVCLVRQNFTLKRKIWRRLFTACMHVILFHFHLLLKEPPTVS